MTFQIVLRVLLIGILFCVPYGIIQYIKKKDNEDGRIKRIEREIVKLAEDAIEDK